MKKLHNWIVYLFDKGSLFARVVFIVVVLSLFFAAFSASLDLLTMRSSIANLAGIGLLLGTLTVATSIAWDILKVYLDKL